MNSTAKKWLRTNLFPPIWCAGCGINDSLWCFVNALEQLQMDQNKTVVVSGIGCTGRISGYIDCDSFHTTHGRAIPFAEGVKLANPELNVIVFSGDGDLFGIGTNHFIHAARRNINITVICVNNFVYGMTKGQSAPTTPQGSVTLTYKQGSPEQALNIQAIAYASGAVYGSRWTSYHHEELTASISQAVSKQGLSVVEIIAPCIPFYTNKNLKLKSFKKIKDYYLSNSTVASNVPLEKICLQKNKKTNVGNFFDLDRPLYNQ